MTDPVIVIVWLVFAHLVADFVLQNDWIAINKGSGTRTGYAALLVHGGHVTLCLLPVVVVFGVPGVVYVLVVATSHLFVDRWKVKATRRAEVNGQAAARKRIAAGAPSTPSGLGAAWTPAPGILFVADQALHLTFAIVGWLVILEGAPPTQLFVDFSNALFGDWDRRMVHAVIMTGVLLTSLFIVNTRGAYYLVLALVSPREIGPDPAAPPVAVVPVPAPTGYTVRVGPIVATVEPSTVTDGDDRSREPVSGTPPLAANSVPMGAPARIGATIGALERLLIVTFVLTRTEALIGFVIAAKTLARFRQLDDRGFAEYYLLGTLASVTVAIISGLVALAALSTL